MIRVEKMSIVNYQGDCIVNAANSNLWEGGGVCGAIFEAAGYRELGNACKAIGHCDTGKAVITLGFNLKAKYIIHAVGPRYGIDVPSDKLLKSAYHSLFELALENGIKTIAVPFLSSGIYGYPKEEAREIAISVAKQYEDKFDDILFATLSYDVVNECAKLL